MAASNNPYSDDEPISMEYLEDWQKEMLSGFFEANTNPSVNEKAMWATAANITFIEVDNWVKRQRKKINRSSYGNDGAGSSLTSYPSTSRQPIPQSINHPDSPYLINPLGNLHTPYRRGSSSQDSQLCLPSSSQDSQLLPPSSGQGSQLCTPSSSQDPQLCTPSSSQDSQLCIPSSSQGSRFMPTGSSHDSRFMPTGSSHDSRFMPIGSSQDSRFMPTGNSQDSRFMPTSSSQDSRFMPTSSSQDSRLVPTGRSQDSRLVPTGRSQDSRFIPTSSSQDTRFMPTGSSQDSRFMPTDGSQDSRFLPTSSSEDSRFMPEGSRHDSRFMPVSSSQDFPFRPPISSQDFPFRPPISSQDFPFRPPINSPNCPFKLTRSNPNSPLKTTWINPNSAFRPTRSNPNSPLRFSNNSRASEGKSGGYKKDEIIKKMLNDPPLNARENLARDLSSAVQACKLRDERSVAERHPCLAKLLRSPSLNELPQANLPNELRERRYSTNQFSSSVPDSSPSKKARARTISVRDGSQDYNLPSTSHGGSSTSIDDYSNSETHEEPLDLSPTKRARFCTSTSEVSGGYNFPPTSTASNVETYEAPSDTDDDCDDDNCDDDNEGYISIPSPLDLSTKKNDDPDSDEGSSQCH